MSKSLYILIEFLGDTPYNIGNYKKVRTYVITYDFSLSFNVEKYDDANAEELQGIFGNSIIVQFTDAIVGVFENSDAVAEGFAYARYYHQTGIDSEWETNPLVKLGEKLMQEHAMLDFHKIVLDTDSRERLLKR